MTTLLALYSRPEGGPEALERFERAYAETHLPLVAATPGLLDLRVHRVVEGLGAPTDVVLVAEMAFADRASLDTGLASDAMREAGRDLLRIAPGLATLLVLEDAPELIPPSRL
jgi:uncharacterized protein (TIGR02118 family)